MTDRNFLKDKRDVTHC